MENYLRERIRERLDAAGISPFEAARKIGAERGFINDLLVGKKDTIRQKAIPALAEVLDCDPAYLIGAQAAPRVAEYAERDAVMGMPVAGICEAGAWRDGAGAGAGKMLPLAPDPRFSTQSQRAYLIRGHHADGLGAADGDIVVAVLGADWRDGDTVIARRTKRGRGSELTVRRVEGTDLRSIGYDTEDTISLGDAEVIARVIAAHRVF